MTTKHKSFRSLDGKTAIDEADMINLAEMAYELNDAKLLETLLKSRNPILDEFLS